MVDLYGKTHFGHLLTPGPPKDSGQWLYAIFEHREIQRTNSIVTTCGLPLAIRGI